MYDGNGNGLMAGQRVLLVEDEHFIVDDLVHTFEASGAEVVGPVASVIGALDLIVETERLDAAVLDVNLQGEMAYPVADALAARECRSCSRPATTKPRSRPATPTLHGARRPSNRRRSRKRCLGDRRAIGRAYCRVANAGLRRNGARHCGRVRHDVAFA